MPSPAHWSWWRRHETLLIGAVVCVLLAMLAGYNVWASRQQHRNAETAAKVEKLSAASCASTRFTFALFNALAEDSSPAFGSPPGGPIIPGARDGLIRQLYAAERVAARGLRRQGCTVKVPARP